jgi:hypothetical protein
MNPQSSTPSNSLIDPHLLEPVVPVSEDGVAISTVSDRLYQIAALTAGIFLLATML